MHNFIKRSIALVLSFALIFGVLPLYAAATDAEATYTGDKLVAINTDFSTSGKISGSFTAQSDLSSLLSMRSLSGSEEEVFEIYRDPDTDEYMTVISPDLPELEPAADSGIMTADLLPDAALSEHAVDDTFSLTALDKTQMDMVCLYIGTYCTVWGTTSDDAVIQLNAEQAQTIGEHFDDFFPKVTAAFGSYWYDADEDGRVAVMCYDIDQDYGTSVSSYTAGYFYSVDMLGLDGRLNGIKFGNTPTNAMDCIHIDTYPLMGYGSPMQRVEDCYDTLVHEFQHMLNFSSLIQNGTRMYPVMPTYLNEAFSMAAEHMICGASATASRVSYFNGSSYVPGTALTYWGSNLSNYSNSYLFGQYVRTRYGALNGDDGSTIFKAVMDNRQSDPYADCLSLIADLLGTTEQDLITDFWCACYLKEETGNRGFQGESWTDSISPHIAADFSSTSAIYNGGAKYYDLTGGFTPASASNVTFIVLDDPEVEEPADAPVLTELTAERLSVTEAKITFTPDQTGTLFYALTSRVITDKSELSNQLEITANAFTTLRIDTLTAPDQTPTFYYFTEADGVQSELQSITIPPVAVYLGILQPYEAELFLHAPSEGTACLALYDTQSGQMLEVFTFEQDGLDFWQIIYTEHDLTACTVKLFLLDENGAPLCSPIAPTT